MDRTHQLGRAVESHPVLPLAKPNAYWREIHEYQVEEGAYRREQRDKQETLDDDLCHILSVAIRTSARSVEFQRLGVLDVMVQCYTS
jgi:hypothetical protein